MSLQWAKEKAINDIFIQYFSIKEVFHVQKNLKFPFLSVELFFEKSMWLILIFTFIKQEKLHKKCQLQT